VQQLADKAREAVQTEADDATIESAQKHLEEALQELMQANAAAQPSGSSDGAPAGEAKKDDDVVDADFKPAG
jgi:molecular chaperone DnaK